MRGQDIVAVATRLFAVYIVVFLLRMIPQIVQIRLRGFDFAVIILVALLMALLAVFLWLFPQTVARKLLPQHLDESPVSPWTLEAVFAVGASLVGVFILAQAVPNVVYWIALILAKQQDANTAGFSPQNYAAMTSLVAEVALGVWLLFGGRGIANAILLMRGRR
jgi:hypothetical protein